MKNWMFILADIGGLFVIILILKSFFAMFGEKRWNKIWLGILFDIIFIGLGVIINIYKVNQIVFAILFYLIIFAFSWLYRIKLFKRAYSTILIYVIIIISEMLMGLLLSSITRMTVEQSLKNIVYYVIVSVVSKLVIFVIIKLISSYVICKTNSIPKMAMLAFIILPITTFSILYFISEYVYSSDNNTIQIISFVLSLLLIVSNIVVFFILDYVSKQKDREKSIETKAKQLEYERQYYSDLYDKQVITDKITHDLKNKFYAFKTLLKEDPIKAETAIEDITAQFNDVSMMKITGNIGIDSLLNHKLSIAKTNGIKVDIECIIGEIKYIDLIDLCVILGNLLDNSIEACLKIENQIDRLIKINIKQEMKFLQITITNTYIKEKIKSKTTKKDVMHHGFGLQNVKELINKYNGYYTVVEENNTYTTIVGVEDRND